MSGINHDNDQLLNQCFFAKLQSGESRGLLPILLVLGWISNLFFQYLIYVSCFQFLFLISVFWRLIELVV